jgi:hypothetical protein
MTAPCRYRLRISVWIIRRIIAVLDAIDRRHRAGICRGLREDKRIVTFDITIIYTKRSEARNVMVQVSEASGATTPRNTFDESMMLLSPMSCRTFPLCA